MTENTSNNLKLTHLANYLIHSNKRLVLKISIINFSLILSLKLEPYLKKIIFSTLKI